MAAPVASQMADAKVARTKIVANIVEVESRKHALDHDRGSKVKVKKKLQVANYKWQMKMQRC